MFAERGRRKGERKQSKEAGGRNGDSSTLKEAYLRGGGGYCVRLNQSLYPSLDPTQVSFFVLRRQDVTRNKE